MNQRRKTDQARMESLVRIGQYDAKSLPDLLDFALDEIIALTRSQIGYIFFYNEITKQFTINTWSKSTLEMCKIPSPQTIYDLDKTGLWGEAVRQSKPIVINEFRSPGFPGKGFPEGHPLLRRFMTIPVFSQGRIVAVLGLANKKTAYTDADVHQVALMMDSIWPITRRQEDEDELALSRQAIQRAPEAMPAELFRKEASGPDNSLSGASNDTAILSKNLLKIDRLAAIAEASEDAIIGADMHGAITDWNNAAEKISGYKEEEIIGKPLSTLVPPDKQNEIDAIAAALRAGQNISSHEIRWQHKSGRLFYVSLSVSRILDKKGQAAGLSIIGRDITEKILTQAALEQSEALYRSIFQHSKAVMLLVDPQTGAVVDANLEACSYYRYSRDELLSMTLSDLSAQTDEEIEKEMARAKREERSQCYFQHRLAGGEVRSVEVFSGQVEIGGKELLFSIIHDITEKKKAEESMRRNEEKYRSIMESVMEGYLEYDLKGNITFANDAACTMLGYPREDLLCMNYSQIASSQAAKIFDQTTKDIIATGAPRKLVDFEIIRRDGSRRIHQHNLSLIRNAEGKPAGMRAMGRDVTELKWAEEALRQSEERIRLLFRNIPVPTFVWKAQHDQYILSEFNSAAFQFTGDKIIDSLGKPAEKFFTGMPQIAADIARCMEQKRNSENQFWYNFDDRSEKRYVIVKYAFAPPDSVLMHVNDITGQKRAEENLQFISIHDSLTGLFNRFYSDAEINRLAASRMRPVSIIVIDLNNLKKINDESGHAMGDLYIKNTANILKQTFRPEDMIARIGGDEFLVLLPLVDENICAQAVERLNEYIRLFNQESEFPISLSAGSATAQAGDNLLERIREADKRMYEEKAIFKASADPPLRH